MNDRLLTLNEAARMLGYSRHWLYHHWREFAPIAFKRPGRKHIKFSEQGLQAWIRQQTTTATPPSRP